MTKPITPAKPTTSLSVYLDTLCDVQELKTLLTREQGKVVKLDETVRLAVREAIDRRRAAATRAEARAAKGGDEGEKAV